MKKLMMLVVAILFASSAWATPIYLGNPVSDLGTSSLPSFTDNNFKGVGYYIWANDAERTSWSVRWTGRNSSANNDYAWYDWSGKVLYSNPEGIDSVTEIRWDTHDGNEPFIIDSSAGDEIRFDLFGVDSEAGPHWDGFDFTLTGASGDYLTFVLEGNFFDDINTDLGVYLGQEYEFVLDNVDSVVDFASADGAVRQFVVAAPVPEPATLLLLGSGLVGLAFMKRRKK